MANIRLSAEQKQSLRDLIESPNFALLRAIANQSKPSVLGGFDTKNDNHCAHQLKLIAGWEMCEKALMSAPDEPVAVAEIEHDYRTDPDAEQQK